MPAPDFSPGLALIKPVACYKIGLLGSAARRPGLRSTTPVQIRFFHLANWTAHEPFADPYVGLRARARTVLENIDRAQICGNARVSDSHRSDALYQGTTLVGPYRGERMRALAPEVLFQVRKTLDEGHGFSRVPMSLRLTQGDENHLDSPIMILRGLEVVFDCAVNGMPLDGFSR